MGLTMASLVRRTVEFLAVAAFAVGVYEIVVAGALALWPNLTDSWILLLWMTAATISGLGMSWIRRLVRSVLGRMWPATSGPSHVLVALATVDSVATTTEQVCADVASLLAAGTGARRAQVWLAEPDGGLRAAGSWPVDSARVEPEVMPAGAGCSALGTLPGVDHVAPISDAGGLLGALVLGARSGRGVTERDRELIAEAAGAVALLLRNLRLNDELAQALVREQEQERRLARSRHRLVVARDVARARLSSEIQGRIGQVLAVCATDVDTLLTADDNTVASANAVLAAMTQRINGAIADFRQIVHGFYPAVLTDHGLEPGLESLLSTLPWPATLKAVGLPRFDQRMEIGVYFCLAAIVGSLRDLRAGTGSDCPIHSVDLSAMVDDRLSPPSLSATVFARMDDHHLVDFDAGTVDPDTIDAIDDRVGALDAQLTISREPTGVRLALTVPIPTAGAAS